MVACSTRATRGAFRDCRFSAWKAARWLGLRVLVVWAACAVAPTPGALAAAAALGGLTFLFGLTLGVHRGLIHESYRAVAPLRGLLVYLGVLTGLGGPLTLYRLHELKDHHQRQSVCPPYLGYGDGALWSYLRTRLFEPTTAPFALPQRLERDRWLRLLEALGDGHQVIVALALWCVGGWSWVVWAGLVRWIVGMEAFWMVNYLSHNRGYVSYPQPGCAEEGRNHKLLGALSFGEGFHNNHHAFPWSARVGLARGEWDLGYLSLRLLARAGVVWDIKEARPDDRS